MKEITIKTTHGDKIVEANIYGELAVHPVYIDKDEWSEDFYNITHIRTKMGVISNLAESEIEESIQLLNNSKINWAFDNITEMKKSEKKRALKIRNIFE